MPGIAGIAARGNHHELPVGLAEEMVGDAQPLPQGQGRSLLQRLPGRGTELAAGQVHAVEGNAQAGERFATAPGPMPFLLEALVQGLAVAAAGEWIGGEQVLQLQLGALQIGVAHLERPRQLVGLQDPLIDLPGQGAQFAHGREP